MEYCIRIYTFAGSGSSGSLSLFFFVVVVVFFVFSGVFIAEEVDGVGVQVLRGSMSLRSACFMDEAFSGKKNF